MLWSLFSLRCHALLFKGSVVSTEFNSGMKTSEGVTKAPGTI